MSKILWTWTRKKLNNKWRKKLILMHKDPRVKFQTQSLSIWIKKLSL